ncbi:MAG: hypothetical protein QM793_06735 [Muricomes sp.]
MVKELKSVTWDKYMDSDIDSMTLFFDEHTDNSKVGEFEVPEEESHLVFYSESKGAGLWNWIMIVNPESVVGDAKATLPDISIQIGEKVYMLQEAVKQLVGKR